MTIDNTRDPLGRLPIVAEGEIACSDKHWLGFTCQAEPDHEGRCRHYDDGGRYEWHKPGPEGEPWQMVVLVRGAAP